MTGLTAPPTWAGTSDDPNDEQFGDVVDPCSVALGAADAGADASAPDASVFDAVLVGEPFDRGVIGRRGAVRGPGAIRTALAAVKTHHLDAGPVGPVGDAGDVVVGDDDPSTVEALQDRVRAVTERLHDADALPLFLGGDNSLSVPNAAPLLDRGSLGVLTLDAHLDVRAVRGDATSGTPYRQLFEAGLDAYACVGARHFETSTPYHDYVRERGGAVVTAEEVGDDPVAAADRALDAMGDVDRVHLSLDVDVLDAAVAPGASAPTPGGLTARECFRLLRLLAADDRVAGFEVVECAPPLDRDGLTVGTAARAVAHVLAARAAGGQP